MNPQRAAKDLARLKLLWILVAGVVGLWLLRRRARRVKSLVFTDAGT